MVKSTLLGAGVDESDLEQPDKPPIQAGTNKEATPMPTCDKNSFLSIICFSMTQK
jgi:hypothetical protein